MVIDIVLLKTNKHLYLDAETQLEWVQENMFFEDDVKLRGSYSYPFSIDRKMNSDALEFIEEFANRTKITSHKCKILVYGNLFYKGQLNILDWTDVIFNVSITRETEDFNTDQYIDEMALGEYINAAGATNRNNTYNVYWPDVDYAFAQYKNYNEDTLQKYGNANSGSNEIIVNWRNGNAQNALNTDIVSPQFYLLGVFKKVFEKLGLRFRSSLIYNDYFKKLLVYNPIIPVTQIFNNCKFYSETGINEGGGLDRYCMVYLLENSNFNLNVGDILSFDIYGIAPDVVLNSYSINHTATVSNLSGGFATFMADLRANIISTVPNSFLMSEDYTTFSEYPYFIIGMTTNSHLIIRSKGFTLDFNTIYNRGGVFILYLESFPIFPDFRTNFPYASPVKMQKHLPHITVSGFLQAAKNEFNLAITLDEVNDRIVIEPRNSCLDRTQIKDFTTYLIDALEGAPNVVPNYVIVCDHDKDSDKMADSLAISADNYAEATKMPKTELPTNAGTLATATLRNSNSGIGIMPHVNQEMGDYFKGVNFSLRFLHLVGYSGDTSGFGYVKADNVGLTANEIYTEYYAAWYNAIKRMDKAHTKYLNLPIEELKNLKPRLWLLKNQEFMWKRCSTIIHNTRGVMATKVEGYKI